MCRGRGGRRPGSGVKKGDKRGPYTKKAGTKKKSEPSAASTAILAAFVASGNTDEAPQDELDDGAHAAVLEVDDKSTVACVPTWAAAKTGSWLQLARRARSITTSTWAEVRAREHSLACVVCAFKTSVFVFWGPGPFD